MFGFIFISFLNRYYPSDEFHLGVPYVLLKRDLSQPEGAFSNTKEAIPAEERLSQLLERLESLEYRLNTESRQKSELADEVAQLREENHRLQEESATAAQQLRRFTEWFFQTIEKA